MLKYLVMLLSVVLIVMLAVTIDARSRPPVHHEPPAAVRNVIYAPGRIEGATAEIELRPQIAGRVAEVFVEEGQQVEPGEALLRLEDDQYRHEVALAAAEVATARGELARLRNGAHAKQRLEAAALYKAKLAEFERAELSWRRISELHQSRAVAQQEADNQRTLVDALRAEVEAYKARLDLLESPPREDELAIAQAKLRAAEARLELAKVQLERTVLRAPMRGQILRRDADCGELTGPTAAEPAVIMADTSRLLVRTFVEELDAPRVTTGLKATITADGLPGKQLSGRVVRLSPRMSRKQLFTDDPAERHDTKAREVWVELHDQRDPLVIGLRVDVTIYLHETDAMHQETGTLQEPTNPTSDVPQ